MYYPNYLEFYQKALVPIGPNDKNALIADHYTVDDDSSHWLIALDGSLRGKRKEYYTWKVVLYPANRDGYFLLKQPYYVSPSYNRFDDAYAAAKSIEVSAHRDSLISTTVQNQII